MIRVGSRKQLFIDERLIERRQGVRLAMNPPVQHPEPVLTPDRPWEEKGIGGYNTIIREPDGLFRMWYAATMLHGLPREGAIRLAYAESRDGIHWDKPELGRISFEGSKANNIVAPPLERQSQQGAAVFRDDRAPAEERYKLLTKFRPTNAEVAAGAGAGLYAMHSPDGFDWRIYPNQPCSHAMCDTQNMFFWDKRIGQYVAYTRVRETQLLDEAAVASGKKGFRTMGRMTSPDFRAWSAQEIVLQADEEDLRATAPEPVDGALPRLDFYTSCAMPYEAAQDVYLMFPSVFHHWGPGGFPARLDVQLLTSRDGVAWRRQGERAPFLRLGLDGGGACGMIFANPWLAEVGDELWLYYAATSRLHVPDAPNGQSGVFRATMRRDGFVSADAGWGGGELVTPAMCFDGERLELNFDGSAGGWAKVEIQGQDGRALEGHSFADADAVTGNATRKVVTWRGAANVGRLAGQPARLRFVMQAAKLYAFQFVG